MMREKKKVTQLLAGKKKTATKRERGGEKVAQWSLMGPRKQAGGKGSEGSGGPVKRQLYNGKKALGCSPPTPTPPPPTNKTNPPRPPPHPPPPTPPKTPGLGKNGGQGGETSNVGKRGAKALSTWCKGGGGGGQQQI